MELEYLLVGLVSVVPAFVIPLFLVGKVVPGYFFLLYDLFWLSAQHWIRLCMCVVMLSNKFFETCWSTGYVHILETGI